MNIFKKYFHLKNTTKSKRKMEMVNNNKLNINHKKILNGATLSQAIVSILKEKLSRVQNTPEYSKIICPKLKVILIGGRQDSKIYVENKMKMCGLIGVGSEVKTFSEDSNKEEILNEIDKSNLDPHIHGIIVQLPLPSSLNQHRTEILSRVELNKDVDGLNPLNQGKILQMNISDCLIPPTAMGVLEILRLAITYENDLKRYSDDYLSLHCFDDYPVNLAGLDVTVLGRGLTAGLPLSNLMQKCDATVTLCHSKTQNLDEKCRRADILISAVGKHKLISRDDVKEGSIVVDVGINVAFDEQGNKTITGDVDFDSIVDKVKYITPVPGGIGKMTVIMLLKNVIKAWGVINKIDFHKV
jgi:methylenetetrahydrofolate dehydrogenase (NADP+)/methenyltetrahydrofolate cyclohydrolase